MSNSMEAEKLYHSSLLRRKVPDPCNKQLVLLEIFHTLSHPAFKQNFSLIDQPNIVEAYASLELIKGTVLQKDIRYDCDLAAGSLLDCGLYCT